MEVKYLAYSTFSLTCGVIAAKWALDLGYSQLNQIVSGIMGLIFGPLALLLLYIRLIYKSLGKKV